MSKENVKKIIQNTGLTRKALAEKLGVTVHAINRWVQVGEMPQKYLNSLSDTMTSEKVVETRDVPLNDDPHKKTPIELAEAYSLEELMKAIEFKGWVIQGLNKK